MPNNAKESAQAPHDITLFKQSFQRHAAGVAIITTLDPDQTPVGFTATSLASLSAVPPMATFNMARSASSWPAIAAAEHVIIHFLTVDNVRLARIMSEDATVRFARTAWSAGPHGLPVLPGVSGWLACRVVQRIPVRNNAVVVVQVEDGELATGGEALLYNNRRYVRPAPLDTAP